MRLLKFNSEFVDIDEKTFIGIDFQAYDIKSPSNRKVSVSNTFSIPKTTNNMRLIGWAGNIQFNSTTVYDTLECDYFNDSYRLINKGKARVVSVTNDRIKCAIQEKPEFWDLLTDVLYGEFQENLLTWLQANKGYPSGASPFVGTFSDFIDSYINTTEGLIIPMYLGNLGAYENPAIPGDYLESTTEIYLKYDSTTYSVDAEGGHICAYYNTIFEYIEDTYSVNLGVLESFDYNIFQDAIASVMYTPLRNISVEDTGTGFYFLYSESPLPYDNTVAYESKTLYDLTKSFFQYFNCLIDKEDLISENPKYLIRRFDDITNADIVDLSDNYKDETREFYPVIKGYKQKNYIVHEKVYDDGNPLTNSKTLTSLNKNLEAGTTEENLFSISAYANNLVDGYANLSGGESLETFSFFISNGSAAIDVSIMDGVVKSTTNKTLQKAEMYSLSSEYNTIDSIITYPVMYNIKRWLSLNDISNLQFFKRYKIRELNGFYFLNKITGYNPDKSQDATKLEFIKIP